MRLRATRSLSDPGVNQMSSPSALESIFFTALEKRSAQERSEFLLAACAGDAELLGRVRSMLDAEARAGHFLEQPAYVHESIAEHDAFDDRPGKWIGAYRLVAPLGEGGMGTVWMAEQTQPVKRLVALKLVKAGMDSKQVIARFEAERQALALMDHPNIARVLDAGTEGGGRPYFVMDLVEGVPITTYCDEHRLTPRERLALFIPVCQALQHAHQKGIIHRDIKPTNVLVALPDGTPVPKVIDFGVAKATEQRLTDRTLFTQPGLVVGTLEYMSPEQAEASPHGLDTRSDIYSLGVLLYELLTGTTPLTRARMNGAAFGEIIRIITEEDPPKPSTRLDDSGEARASISARRHMDPDKLTKLVRGELDWIVMRALEKDRTRRYESASSFASDVQRYLMHEPVMAGPPSASYRLRKFARRNRGKLLASGVLVTAFVTAVGGVGWALRDRSARLADVERERTERRERVAALVQQLFDDIDLLAAEQLRPHAVATTRRAAAIVAEDQVDAQMTQRVHGLLQELEFIDGLEKLRLAVVRSSGETAKNGAVAAAYSRAFRSFGVDVETQDVETSIADLGCHRQIALPLAASLDHWFLVRAALRADSVVSAKLVAVARGIDPEPLRDRVRSSWLAPTNEAERTELLELAASIDVRAQHPTTLLCLGGALDHAGHADSGLRLLQQAQLAFPGDFWLSYALGLRFYEQEDYVSAIRFFTAAISIRPSAAPAYNNLGSALCRTRRMDEAVAVYQEALALDPSDAMAHANLGNALSMQGKCGEALIACRKAVELDPDYALGFNSLGNVLVQLRELDAAVAAYRRAIELDPEFATAHVGLGRALNLQHKPDEALDRLHKAIELDPACAPAFHNLGIVLKGMKKLDEAIASYRRSVDIDPHFGAAYSSLGIALSERNDVEGAVAALKKAVELVPDSADAHQNLAVMLGRLQKPDEALASCRRAVEIDPKNAKRQLALGNSLHGLARFDEALTCYREAARLDPRSSVAYGCMGDVFLLQRKAGESAASYRKAVEIDPRYANAYIGLGRALRELGEIAGAISAFEEALRIQPRNAGRADELARLLVTCEDPELRNPPHAVELAETAVGLDPSQSRYLETLGMARYRAGQWAEARAAFERSMELRDGGDAQAWWFLAMIHFQLGETRAARDWYERAAEHVARTEPADAELRSLQVEAARVLGIEAK